MKTAYIDLDEFDSLVAAKLVTKKEHRDRPGLFIYNYTPLCAFNKAWDRNTMIARGLVTDAEGRIVARPLPKFFNAEEHKTGEVPWYLRSEVTTKMDGSMLIVQRLADGSNIYATRGSFHSEQAEIGRKIFEAKYADVDLDPDYTYVFEVIYPENRIVVHYGDYADVVLLAMVNVATGEELPLSQAPAGLTLVEVHDFPGIDKIDDKYLKSLERRNMEGFVVKFANGMRVKIKFDEYCHLHRVVTGVSSKTVWEHLRDKRDLESLLENTPDEFNEFVRGVRDDLMKKFDEIRFAAYNVASMAISRYDSRKDRANYIKEETARLGDNRLPGVVFAMLDGKDWETAIWRHLQPEYKQPFTDRE